MQYVSNMRIVKRVGWEWDGSGMGVGWEWSGSSLGGVLEYSGSNMRRGAV